MEEKITLAHIPVMLEETLNFLAPSARKNYLDCTFGGGGHSKALLEAHPSISVVAIDEDPEAKERAELLIKKYKGRFSFYSLNFRELDTILESEFDGILFDFGVSSFQLNHKERGFSFREDALLDMRMNPNKGYPAYQFLETASQEHLIKAIREYGEEKYWKKIVKAIIAARGSAALHSTVNFANLIASTLPRPHSQSFRKIHPATRTFQGIRIFINDELNAIAEALPKAFQKVKIGGIIVGISFHSLEDKLVKRYFRKISGKPESVRDPSPQDLRVSYAKMLTQRPVVPSQKEVETNPRSRSAKLRALKKERNTHAN